MEGIEATGSLIEALNGKVEDNDDIDVNRKRKSATEAGSKKKKSRSIYSKSRTKGKRSSKQAAGQSDVPESELVDPAGGEDPNKLYCYCQQPYNAFLFYIGCENCDGWFHGTCAKMTEEDADDVSSWFCNDCTAATGKVPIWRPRCAAYEFMKECRKRKAEEEQKRKSEEEASLPMKEEVATELGPKLEEEIPQQHEEAKPTETEASSSEQEPAFPAQPLIQPLPPEFTLPLTCKRYLPDPTNLEPTEPTSLDQLESKPAEEDQSLTCPKPFHQLLPIMAPEGSRFCSDSCGLTLARHTLLSAIHSKKVPKKDATLNTSINEDILKHPPVKDTPSYSEEVDRERLRKLVGLIHLMKLRVRAIEELQKNIDGAIERAWKALVPVSLIDGRSPVSTTSQPSQTLEVSSAGGEPPPPVQRVVAHGKICGFDTRIIKDWLVPDWPIWVEGKHEKEDSMDIDDMANVDSMKQADNVALGSSKETGVANGEEQEGMEPVDTMCMAVGRCELHHNWKTLRSREAELELELQVSSLLSALKEYQWLKRRMLKRRADWGVPTQSSDIPE
ncbi:hypothetical protein HDV05_000522 [Chytridiales sp. JEL 0842]|nr:hypothetical protein HDV05_000522 [Chytridiales sp. JEL 0842]